MSFSDIDATLASDNLLSFKKNLLDLMKKLIMQWVITLEIKKTDIWH